MTNRRRLTTRERLAVFFDAHGICHICGCHIDAGQKWEVSHPTPLELGGVDDMTNRRPAHLKCHRRLTAVEDIPRIAKAHRQEAAHIGARAPKVKIPCRPRQDRPCPDKLPMPKYRDLYTEK